VTILLTAVVIDVAADDDTVDSDDENDDDTLDNDDENEAETVLSDDETVFIDVAADDETADNDDENEADNELVAELIDAETDAGVANPVPDVILTTPDNFTLPNASK
jgi:hypothetical protein